MLANVLTLSRLGFLTICVWLLLYQTSAASRWLAFGLVLLIIFIDAIDGTIARKRGEATPLGSVLDIAIDRVVENVFWILLTYLGHVPVWGAILVVTRGILTDAVRGFGLAQGMTPFGMMQTVWGRWLVSHRLMRAVSGTTKVITFAGWTGFMALQFVWQDGSQASLMAALEQLLQVMTMVTIGVNLVRGVPVLVESRRFFKYPSLRPSESGN
jgi:CDP-diacylglycerol--glycerol-3-phosphate 3-phosphatidyltransferase